MGKDPEGVGKGKVDELLKEDIVAVPQNDRLLDYWNGEHSVVYVRSRWIGIFL